MKKGPHICKKQTNFTEMKPCLHPLSKSLNSRGRSSVLTLKPVQVNQNSIVRMAAAEIMQKIKRTNSQSGISKNMFQDLVFKTKNNLQLLFVCPFV